ncbi:MAG: hypothetical protein J6W35_05205 [Eubacterium sp.]|nr:hypothetical protein [Eubacterium sp.]
MKKIVSLVLVITLIASCGLLVGCGEKEKKKDPEKEAISKVNELATEVQKNVEDISKAVETEVQKASKEWSSGEKAIEDASKAFSKKAPKKPTVHGSGIAGVWGYNQKDYKIPAQYTFKKDGTGEYNIAGQIQKLTWKTKGNKITITYKGQPDMTQKYKLKGDVLTLYDITDSPVVYYRVG